MEAGAVCTPLVNPKALTRLQRVTHSFDIARVPNLHQCDVSKWCQGATISTKGGKFIFLGKLLFIIENFKEFYGNKTAES